MYANQKDYKATQHFFDTLGRETNTVTRCTLSEGALSNPASVLNRGWVSRKTTDYPFGTSDYSVYTDKRELKTVSFSVVSAEAETFIRQIFHPTNTLVPVIAQTNVLFRNGTSIITTHRESKWVRETRFTKYAEDGTQTDFTVSKTSDYTASITNAISYSDFLGRGIVQTTPLETVTSLYDGARSRILCTISSASPAITNLYNDLGERIGVISVGVTTLTLETYETLSNEIWRVLSRFQIADAITKASAVRVRDSRDFQTPCAAAKSSHQPPVRRARQPPLLIRKAAFLLKSQPPLSTHRLSGKVNMGASSSVRIQLGGITLSTTHLAEHTCDASKRTPGLMGSP